MTTPANPVPAGWYPDPAGTPQTRWWDGAQWTEHYQAPSQSAQPYVAQPYGAQPASALRAPEGTPAYNLFAVAIIALLVLGNISILPLFDLGYFEAAANEALTGTPTGWETFDRVTSILAWLFYAGSVALAVFDVRSLRDSGVQGPFHWAFAFLGAPVYLIGRGIITRRRTGSGISALWFGVGQVVVNVVVFLVALVIGFTTVFDSTTGL